MELEARNALPEHWLQKLCAQLSRAQSVKMVQAILDGFDGLHSDNQVESVLRQLLDTTEHKHLLELVLAYGSWSQRLSAWLLKSFPKHCNLVDEFYASLHSKILERLSNFLLLLPCTFDRETQLFLSEARFQVERTPHVLKSMINFAHGKTEVVADVDEADSRSSVIGKKQTRAHQKQARKMERQKISLKQQDLARLNVNDPQTKAEAFSNASSLLDTLRGTFRRYFGLLQKPEIYLATQNMFVGLVSTATYITPEAYPSIQPMAPALYFESASVFGEWRILISSRIDRYLREIRRSDSKLLKIVIKKIIELSKGQFSDDNQQRLNKPDVQFPVYEAKVTADTRLVYQIDCVPNYDGTCERQVIRIFCVYPRAMINEHLWDSMGYQLSKKGKIYCERCTFRKQPHHEGDHAIPPATFPLLEKDVSDTNNVPRLSEENRDEIHSLLVLEKFIALSKELLKSIVVDLDVTHVFDVSPEQKGIIEHQYSCCVLGRSGTGELLGVIKGSEQSLSHETRYLDLKTYKNLSVRTQHVFAKQRDQIYSIFLAYMNHKKQRGEDDTTDRTHRILKAFNATGIPGAKIDYLYVDEVQDNLLIDVMLLQSLCRNRNGLFWAGDTAQRIAIGSSFRFDDLTPFLYRLEQLQEQDKKGTTQPELQTFKLTTNYRSHGGIIQCAAAVIGLITHFWPYAIDSLKPEQAVVDGVMPIFFSGWNTETVHEQFLSGNSGKQIEFGARQCILVRDEAAKAKLQEQVGGGIGLILTLYESKGLEFDDVLLYNFFEDSTVNLNQWRVVLNLIEKPKEQDNPAPRFDEKRHAGVCSELQFLYVAITRSRKNLWIVDCSDKAEPMKMLWQSKGHTQSCGPGDKVPQLAASSTSEEWATTGYTLFTNRRYLQAKHAFERAGRAREAKISYTHHLRDTAHSIQPSNKETTSTKRKELCFAAESFLECARDSKGKQQRVFFHNAAECFENAGSCGDNMGDYQRAAEAYENAKEYTAAVRLYKKTEMFDEAVHIIQKHRQEVDEELANDVQEVATRFYSKKFRKAKTLIESVEEQPEYLEGTHLDETVQLRSSEKPNFQKPPTEGIRRVFFKNPDDVPSALSVGAQTANADSGSNSTVKTQGLGDTPTGTEQPVDQQVEQPAAILTDIVRKDLALRLLYHHRQRVRNKELEKYKTTTQKTCDSSFETCLKLVADPNEMQWTRGSYYKKLYLGLVPHLLACVKAVESYALSAWSEARDQSRKEKQDYDDMYRTKSEIIAILKESRKLGSRLDPSSEVHRKRDVEGLKQLACEVEQLVNRVPSGADLDVHFNLQLAMKGISNAGPERG
ncbi:hypothetical protein EST38_g12789 [Candolleomyces aberdarensis]|uniref:UvrD-like helicase ATP-binding domain-containing protein n=1 Tax=Candolleomyces aberdarensis TaxID=2316362 RepID=A0A4Q2D4I9_9AGAR|nr:hypothetical protein EST38_g12789 [Candolleomyces aberdarensis]